MISAAYILTLLEMAEIVTVCHGNVLFGSENEISSMKFHPMKFPVLIYAVKTLKRYIRGSLPMYTIYTILPLR